MLSVKDVARLLNVSAKKIYHLIDQDKIPVYKVGEEYQFNRIEIVEWATSIGIKISENTTASDEELPTFSDAIQAGSIMYGIDGNDKTTVLRNIVTSLNLPASVNRDVIYEIIIAREKLGSTGIGDGIAIPHVRNPVVLNVQTPVVTLSFLKNPIDFESIDKLPVTVLFTIISPSVRVHLHLLSRLAFVLQNPAFKASIMNQAAAEIIIQSLKEAEKKVSSVKNGTPGASV